MHKVILWKLYKVITNYKIDISKFKIAYKIKKDIINIYLIIIYLDSM